MRKLTIRPIHIALIIISSFAFLVSFFQYASAGVVGSLGYSVVCPANQHWNGTSACVWDQYTLTMTLAGNGSGSTTGAGTYNYGTAVTATATASTGSSFSGWTGDCNSSGQVTMTAARSCTATFTLNTYTLSVGTAGTGSGTVSGGGTYNYGTTATAGATPASNSTFSGWTGDCNSSGQVTIDANKSCTANFTAIPAATVTTTASPNPIGYNSSSTISWTSTNSTSCSYNSGAVASPSGSFGTGNLTTSTAYTIYCNGPGGTGYGSVTVSVAGAPYGTLTANAATCAISSGASSCGIGFSWSTGNPIGTSAVTSAAGTQATGNSGSATFTVPYGSRTFYLYNAGYLLDQKTVSSACVGGTAWNGSFCVPPPTVSVTASPSSVGYTGSSTISWTSTNSNSCSSPSGGGTGTTGSFGTGSLTASQTYTVTCYGPAGSGSGSATVSVAPAPSGTLTPAAASCAIGANASSCGIGFSWSTSNPMGTSAVTTPRQGTVATGNSGAATFSVPYSSDTFYLYNNGYLLAQSSVSSYCTGGTTWNGSVCALPSGSLTPAAGFCPIGAGSNFCTINFTWSTSYPIGTSAVTRDSYGTIINANSGSQGFAIPYNGATFRLYNNGNELANSSVNSYCTGGTTWNGSVCTLPTGTLSASPASCTVPPGANSCNTTLTWSTSYPVGTSAITRTGGVTVDTGNSGSGSYSFPYNGTTFYLYNNGNLLDQKSVTSSCVAGTTWDGSSCQPPTGTLTSSANSCQIAARANSCTIPFTWNTLNPIGTSAVTQDGYGTVATGNSGSNVSFTVPYNSATFRLYNNSNELANKSVTAACTPSYAWNGSVCVPPSTVNLTANPTQIAYNTASTLSWTSTDASSCTLTGGGLNVSGTSGSVSTGNRTSATTYTVNCAGWAGNSSSSVTVYIVPSILFTSNPKLMISGRYAKLTWSATNATSCTGTNFSTGAGSPVSGYTYVKPTKTITYTVTCAGYGGTSKSASLKANVTKIKFKEL